MSPTRIPIRPLLAPLALALLTAGAAGQSGPLDSATGRGWEALGQLAGAGPYVTDLLADALDTERVYASSSAGLLRSTDRGASWSVVSAWPDGWGLANNLAVSPTAPERMALTVWLLGVRISTDGGVSWWEPSTPPEGTQFPAVACDPVDAQTIFVGTDLGVWRATDGGSSFERVLDTTITGGSYCRHLFIDRNNHLRVYALVQNAGVFLSEDGGDSWTLRAFPAGLTTPLCAALDPRDGRRLLIGGNGIHLSENAGVAWGDAGFSGSYIDSLAFDPLDPDRFYAGFRYGGLAITDNAGASWVKSDDPGLERMGGNPLAILPSLAWPGELLVAGRGGFARSTNGGASFQRTNAGLEAHAEVESIAVDAGDPLHLVAKTGGSAFVSLDGGASWTESLVGHAFYGRDVVADRVTPGRFWAGGLGGEGGRLWRSDDGGASFYVVFEDPTIYFWHLEPHPMLTNVLFGAGRGVQRSDDGGHSFTNLGLPANWVWDVAVSPTDPDVIYANASGGVMYWSHNGGATWTAATEPPPATVRDIEVDPVDPHRAWAAVPFQGLWRTDDGGATWVLLAPQFTDALAVHRPNAFPGLLAVAGLGRHEARASHDAGDTGFVLGRAFESAVLSFASTATALFAATEGDGVFVLR